MTSYVLGDEALYGLLIGRDNNPQKPLAIKVRQWAEKRTAQDYLFASRISVAMLAASIERIPDILKRDSTRDALQSKLIAQFNDSMLEVDQEVLKHWSILRASADDGGPHVLSSEQMIEVATAIHTGYIYVARLTEPLKRIKQSIPSLTIEDPWR